MYKFPQFKTYKLYKVINTEKINLNYWLYIQFIKLIILLIYDNKNLFLLIYLKENKIKNKIKYYTINLIFFFFYFI